MIDTYSAFIYGFTTTSTNQSIDFDEGGGELQATIPVGSYSLADYVTAIQNAMNAVGGQTYTVAVNRSTRIITISASSNFSLLASTGSRVGTGAWITMGFDATDNTGANSYDSDNAVGTLYEPQFWLQDYLDKRDNKESISPTVSESASGVIEVIKFGSRQFYEMKIDYVTNRFQDPASVIKNDADGVESARSFLEFCIEKGPIEFIPDVNDKTVFDKVTLESTPESSDGVSYRLKEKIGESLSGYYSTGILRFRVN